MLNAECVELMIVIICQNLHWFVQYVVDTFPQDMQLQLLKYREDVITAKVAQEHSTEQLKSEILFLRSQIVAEQQERTNMEESLTQEIQQLQEQLGQ